jgi:hypothetical protein
MLLHMALGTQAHKIPQRVISLLAPLDLCGGLGDSSANRTSDITSPLSKTASYLGTVALNREGLCGVSHARPFPWEPRPP